MVGPFLTGADRDRIGAGLRKNSQRACFEKGLDAADRGPGAGICETRHSSIR